jgi:hypothetical protein
VESKVQVEIQLHSKEPSWQRFPVSGFPRVLAFPGRVPLAGVKPDTSQPEGDPSSVLSEEERRIGRRE